MAVCSPSDIFGCKIILPEVKTDSRGRFVKIFEERFFSQNGLSDKFSEEYYSESRQGVIRGLHFQSPPNDHDKVVTCLIGEVLDVTIDLRVGSPTYMLTQKITLSAENGASLYVPSGIAHGFCVLSKSALLLYKTTSPYSAESDAGILWSSVPVIWPVADPIVSERDKGFPPLKEFVTPFNMNHADG